MINETIKSLIEWSGLKRFLKREEIESLIDYLPYRDISDGIVFLESGNYEIGFELNPPSNIFVNPETLESTWLALRGLLEIAVPEYERVRVMVTCYPGQPKALNHFKQSIKTNNPTLKRLLTSKVSHYETQSNQGHIYDWHVYLGITMNSKSKKPPKHASKIRKKSTTALSPMEYQDLVSGTQKLRETVMNYLIQAGYQPRPLSDQDLFNIIFWYLNPGLTAANPPKFIPAQERPFTPVKEDIEFLENLHLPTLKRQLTSSAINNLDPAYLVIGDKLSQNISFYTRPENTITGMIGPLMKNLREQQSFILTIDMYHDALGKTLSSLYNSQNVFYQLGGAGDPKGGLKDPSAPVKQAKVEKAIAELVEGASHPYQAAVGLTYFASTKEQLEQMKNLAISLSTRLEGSLPVYGDYQHFMGYFAMLPFSGRINHRHFRVISKNAADLFPPFAPWSGHTNPNNLYRTRWGSIMGINLFDQSLSNWNGIISAKSGWGKTFSAQTFLLGELGTNNTDLIIIDKGYGYAPLIEMIAGKKAIIPISKKVCINPFDLSPGQEAPDDEKAEFLIDFLRAIVPPGNDNETTATEDAIFFEAIKRTYRMWQSSTQQKREQGIKVGMPTLSHFATSLQTLAEINSIPLGERQKELKDSLVTRLQNWVGERSPYGNFVDGQTTVDTSQDSVYYEVTGLEGALGPVGIMLITELVYRKAKQNTSRKKLVLIDEAWSMLSLAPARKLVVDLFRRARRYNMGVYAISQSPHDFAQIPGILDNANTFLLGPTSIDKEMWKAIGLEGPPSEYQNLSQHKGKFSEFLLLQRTSAGLQGEVIRIESDPETYWALTTDPNDMAKRQKAIEQMGTLEEAISELARR